MEREREREREPGEKQKQNGKRGKTESSSRAKWGLSGVAKKSPIPRKTKPKGEGESLSTRIYPSSESFLSRVYIVDYASASKQEQYCQVLLEIVSFFH